MDIEEAKEIVKHGTTDTDKYVEAVDTVIQELEKYQERL